MKIAFFTTKEAYIESLESIIKQRKKALQQAKDLCDKTEKGTYKDAWLKTNNIKAGTAVAEASWQGQIEWAQGGVKYATRRLRKAEKDLAKARAMYM